MKKRTFITICTISGSHSYLLPHVYESLLSQTRFHFEAGLHTLTVSPLDPGVVLEKIQISPWDTPLPPSYFGPEESWLT